MIRALISMGSDSNRFTMMTVGHAPTDICVAVTALHSALANFVFNLEQENRHALRSNILCDEHVGCLFTEVALPRHKDQLFSLKVKNQLEGAFYMAALGLRNITQSVTGGQSELEVVGFGDLNQVFSPEKPALCCDDVMMATRFLLDEYHLTLEILKAPAVVRL